MTRFDPRSLAIHIEWALSCAPHTTLEALRDDDALKRRLAMIDLAGLVAEQLVGIETGLPLLDGELPLPLAISSSAM